MSLQFLFQIHLMTNLHLRGCPPEFFFFSFVHIYFHLPIVADSVIITVSSRLVIDTSRTVGSAKKLARTTSGPGGGEPTKTPRKARTCQKLKLSPLPLEHCKIRECHAVANAFTTRNMYSSLLHMKCNSRKINRPTKNTTTTVTLLHLQVVPDKDASQTPNTPSSWESKCNRGPIPIRQK